ncbi:hypothetical protein HMPREF1117_0785 [Streptococcus sp. SK643]|nr:hypothetical protein HMPREF1117_0785 [Streptococcus sp. SK643]
METLSYCQWTFPYWFNQFSYFRRGLWNLSSLYTEDLAQNGYLVLLALACCTGYKWKRG